MSINKEKIEEALTRGVTAIYPSKDDLEKKLLKGDKISLYFGIDPTTSDLHLGHTVGLLALRRFQDLGQKTILLIGDYTARIGDPTDKAKARRRLSEEQVKENMRTFKDQSSKILYFDKKSGEHPVEIRYNSEWYKKMTIPEFVSDILGYFTVSNMLQRDMFKERKSYDDIQMQELIYPLLQGYDGVELDVDVEIGGNDQLFNMNIGRALREAHSKGDEPKAKKGEKFFIALKLLANPVTGKKFSKTEGNLINIKDEPSDMFGKIMALPDEVIFDIAELTTKMPMIEAKELSSKKNPRDAKLKVAFEVVKLYHGESEAKKAQEKWDKLFSKKDFSNVAQELSVKDKKISALNLVLVSNVCTSKSEARRLIEQGGVDVNGKKVTDPNKMLHLKKGEVVRIGKKYIAKIS